MTSASSTVRLLSQLLLFFVAAFGIWTFYVWVALWLGWNFDQLSSFSWVMLPSAIAAAWLARAAANAILDEDDAPRPPAATASPGWANGIWWPALSLLLLIGALALTAGKVNGSFTVPWLLFAASCIALVIYRPIPAPAQFAQPALRVPALLRSDGFMYLSVTALLVMAYALSGNTDADDTHFLGSLASLLKQPAAPLFKFDPLFGEANIQNYVFDLNRGQSWEALVALVSRLTGMNHITLYYWWMPLALLVQVPVALFLVLRRYYPDWAWAGTLFAVLFLLGWSTFNHHGGHFFVPRLFQGKATFMALMVPALFLIVGRFVRRPDTPLFVLVTLSFIASGGLTSTGLMLGLLVAGICYLAFIPAEPRRMLLVAGLLALAAIPTLVMLADIAMEAFGSGSPGIRVIKDRARDMAVGKNASMYGQFGGGYMLAMIMVMIWLGIASARAFVARVGRESEMLRLLLVIVLIAFSRPFAEFATQLTGVGNLNWRWHWALPISVVLGLGAAGLWRLAFADQRAWAWGRIGGINSGIPRAMLRLGLVGLPILILLALFGFNSEHLQRKYMSRFTPIKLAPSQLSLLRYLDKRDLSGRVILADTRAAQLFPRTLQNARLISAGPLYWSKPYFSRHETRARYALEKAINSRQPLTHKQLDTLRLAMRDRPIEVVIYDARRKIAAQVNTLMKQQGLHCTRVDTWRICERGMKK